MLDISANGNSKGDWTMSYCRWSTDDFQCDLYCYESGEGFITHVAGLRVRYKTPLPEPVDEFDFNVSWKRHETVMEMLDDAEREPIGLPYDGKKFYDPDLPSFLERVKMLQEVGYNVPDYLIPMIVKEIGLD